MESIITEHPQISYSYPIAVAVWLNTAWTAKKLLEPDKYKDIIISSLRFCNLLYRISKERMTPLIPGISKVIAKSILNSYCGGTFIRITNSWKIYHHE